jgi:signal transduction histidine kinase
MTSDIERQSPWRVAARAFATAPPRSRLIVAALVLSSLAAVGVQFLDGTTGWDLIEFTGVITGTAGSTLLGIAYTLQRASQSADESCWRMPFSVRTHTLHAMLFAIPTLGFVAGALLSVALGIVFARVVDGSMPLLIAAVVYGVLLVHAALLVSAAARFLYGHAREQADAAARAHAEAARAELSALQAQMNPHFLFNALNTVASLVRTDRRAAEATVENLASVLRRTLDRSGRTLTTVREELDYLAAYIGIEQERWGDRLSVRWDVEPEAMACAVPTMTLQPLVENSLKHAVGARLDSSRLAIGVRRTNGTLLMRIEDDGPGFPPSFREGTGLGNLRRRLATLYGDEAELTIEPAADGAHVLVRVPAQGPRAG